VAVRIVQLGQPRIAGEGIRVGTVRRPPRGVPKREVASRDFYDVWLPTLAPSDALLKATKPGADERTWQSFARRYRAEMKRTDPRQVLDLLSALSHRADFSVGCYCQDERRCHRSILRGLLAARGAAIA
jgi:uncharacterized protein YeaO (DUF488 family)